MIKITGDDDNYLILAGDNAYTQKSFRERIIPGFTVDTKLAKKSLAWICDCAADSHCRLVAADHDPSVKEQVIEL